MPKVGERCTLYGTILCRGPRHRPEPSSTRGTVLGAEGMAGEDSVLMERVGLAGEKGPEGARLTASLVSGGGTGRACLGDGGVIRGTLEEELSPELLMTLGGALREAGWDWDGYGGASVPDAGPLRRMWRRGGGRGGTPSHDGGCPSVGGLGGGAVRSSRLPLCGTGGERIFLHFFFDRRGCLSPRPGSASWRAPFSGARSAVRPPTEWEPGNM